MLPTVHLERPPRHIFHYPPECCSQHVTGIRGVFASQFVAYCAAFAALGGFLFGYDQGVVSVTLVMEEFLNRFPEVSDEASGSGFKKGLMTAIIPLGAFIGALNQGWVADWISRKRSLMVAVVIFTVGHRSKQPLSIMIC